MPKRQWHRHSVGLEYSCVGPQDDDGVLVAGAQWILRILCFNGCGQPPAGRDVLHDELQLASEVIICYQPVLVTKCESRRLKKET